MVKLEETQFIGKGRTKACYSHPSNEMLCIKIIHNSNANPKELKKELRELARIERKKHSSLPFGLIIPRYYGTIDTTLGIGYIFDKIIKKNGSEYPTLRAYLTKKNTTLNEGKILLKFIHDKLYESAIIISELNPDNILIIQEGEEPSFALIDGFGEGAIIRLAEFLPYFARQKMMRKFPPFEKVSLSLIPEYHS